MSTPPPIAFDVAKKPAAGPRGTPTAAGDRTFADAVQAQRQADQRNRDDAATVTAHTTAQTARQANTAVTVQAGSTQTESSRAPAHQANGREKAEAAQADRGQATTPAVTRLAEKGGSDHTVKTAGHQVGKGNSAPQTTASAPPLASSGVAPSPDRTTPAAGEAAQGNKPGTMPQDVQIKVVRKDNPLQTARPANAATAFAAQTASKEPENAGSKTTSSDTTAAAKNATSTSTSRTAVGDPTAQALKEALSGNRATDDVASTERPDDRRVARRDAQSAVPRTMGGISPALRAAAEAVQQQTNGGTSGNTAATQSNAVEFSGQRAQQAARVEAAALQGASPAANFDPVMQANGPQASGQLGNATAVGKGASASAPSSAPAPTAPPAEQVAVQIQRATAQGQSRVQIRLNPAELGRVDVKLDIGDDGHVRAVLAVDKAETLDLMQRDPRALEKALQAAGLKTDSGSLSFNLRQDQSGHNAAQHQPRTSPEPQHALDNIDDQIGENPMSDPTKRGLGPTGRIDIRI